MRLPMNSTKRICQRVTLGLGALSALGFWGCGTNYSGTFVGTEMIAITGTGGPSTAATLNLIQTSNDFVSGTLKSDFGNGVLEGRTEGGRIGAIKLTFVDTTARLSDAGTLAPNTANFSIGPSGQVKLPPCGPYTGILTAVGPNQLMGILTYESYQSQMTPPAGVIAVPYPCPMTRQFTLTR